MRAKDVGIEFYNGIKTSELAEYSEMLARFNREYLDDLYEDTYNWSTVREVMQYE